MHGNGSKQSLLAAYESYQSQLKHHLTEGAWLSITANCMAAMRVNRL